MLTLSAIAAATYDDETLNGRFYVERLGSNVYAVVDYAGHTLTIDEGQSEVDTEQAPADVEVFLDGGAVASGVAETVEDVLVILGRVLGRG